jgi:hypothetical protein
MGKRNFNEFIDVFDKVFVLDVDVDTLNERLDNVLMMTGARARASGHSSFVYTLQKKTYEQWHRNRCNTAACQRRGRNP